MSLQVITKDAVIEKRVLAKAEEMFSLYAAPPEAMASAVDAAPSVRRNVVMTGDNWEGSSGRKKLYEKIAQTSHRIRARMNAQQVPLQADLDDLFAMYFVDITRFRMEGVDLTSEIATEITNVNFPQTINLRELIRARGMYEKIQGNNDSVSLIEQGSATVDTLNLDIMALGWKSSIANELFNPLNNMQQVMQALAEGDIDSRNSKTVGVIVGATYHSSQKTAAVNTATLTYDERLYETLVKAIKQLQSLKDEGTGKLINSSAPVLLVNSADTWSLERVVRGKIQSNKGGGMSSNQLAGLPISKIIQYNEGITHGLDWGARTIEYPGVEAGKAYLLVPKLAFWVANKLGLTTETGMGSVLQLARKETVNYRVQGEYYKPFLGSSFPGKTKGGFGYVVEVTLPTS